MASVPLRSTVHPDPDAELPRAGSVIDLVAHLEPLQQQVVRLVYLEGRTHRETARILAVERGVVSGALAGAFRRIARRLAEEDGV